MFNYITKKREINFLPLWLIEPKFKIDARLWRANDPKVIISSPEFSFKILTEDAYQYPEPNNGDYRLEPKKNWESG